MEEDITLYLETHHDLRVALLRHANVSAYQELRPLVHDEGIAY